MWRRCVFGGLFLVACLALIASSQAWQNGKLEKGYPKSSKAPPKAKSSNDSWELLAKPEGPETVLSLLTRLKKIKEERAALDKEEKSIVEKIKSQLEDQRQKIIAAEQELEKIAPTLFEKKRQTEPERNPQRYIPLIVPQTR
jgi:hypothetical protein